MKIIKFYADWCKPCKVLESNLQQLGIEHESIDIESEKGVELSEKYGIRNIPYILKLDEDASVIDHKVGVLSVEHLKDWLNEDN